MQRTTHPVKLMRVPPERFKRLGPKNSKYTKDSPVRAFKLSLLGSKNEHLAVAFDIDINTLNKWIRDYPEFADAVRKGRQEADAEVALSLYQRAIGYSHPDVHIAVVDKEIVITPITKHYPPDTAAAIKWLAIRQREFWMDESKLTINHQGTVHMKNMLEMDLSDFSNEELELMAKLGLKKQLQSGVHSN